MGLSSPGDCNVYLWQGPSGLLLIDAGSEEGTDEILSNIQSDGLNPGMIEYILLTHAHPDHACGAVKLALRVGAKVLVSTEAVGTKHMPPPENGLVCTIGAGMGDPVGQGEWELPTASGLAVRAISVHGHSRDSVCYLAEIDGRRVLASGDVVYPGGRIGLINYEGSSLEDYRSDIGKLSGLKVDAFLPGHSFFVIRDGQKHIDLAARKLEGIYLPLCIGQIDEA